MLKASGSSFNIFPGDHLAQTYKLIRSIYHHFSYSSTFLLWVGGWTPIFFPAACIIFLSIFESLFKLISLPSTKLQILEGFLFVCLQQQLNSRNCFSQWRVFLWNICWNRRNSLPLAMKNQWTYICVDKKRVGKQIWDHIK